MNHKKETVKIKTKQNDSLIELHNAFDGQGKI
jgi:hypothetical protein